MSVRFLFTFSDLDVVITGGILNLWSALLKRAQPPKRNPAPGSHTGVSENRGPKYRTLNNGILTIRTPKIRYPYFRKLPYHKSSKPKGPTIKPTREFPKIRGTLFWGPCNKDPTIWGTILGSPIFGNSHDLNTALRRAAKGLIMALAFSGLLLWVHGGFRDCSVGCG